MDLSSLTDFTSAFLHLFKTWEQSDVLILPAYSSLLQISLASLRELFPDHQSILFVGPGQASHVDLTETMLSLSDSLPSSATSSHPPYFYPMPQDLLRLNKKEWRTMKESWFFVAKENSLFSELAKLVHSLLDNQKIKFELNTESQRLKDVKMRIYLLMWMTSLPKTMPMYDLCQTVLFKWLKALSVQVCTTEWNVLHIFRQLDIPIFLRQLDEHAKTCLFSPLQPLTLEAQKSFSLLDWHPRSQLMKEWQKEEIATIRVQIDGSIQRLEYVQLPNTVIQARSPTRPCALHLFSSQSLNIDVMNRSLFHFLYSIGHPIYNQLSLPLLEWCDVPIESCDADGVLIYMVYTNQLLFINSKLMCTFLQNWLAFANRWSFHSVSSFLVNDEYQSAFYHGSDLIGPLPKHMVLNITSLIILEQLRKSQQPKKEKKMATAACLFEIITPDTANMYPPKRPRLDQENKDDPLFCTFEYNQARILLLDRCKVYAEEISYDYWEGLGLGTVVEQVRTKVSSVLAPIFQKHMLKTGGNDEFRKSSFDHRQIESDILMDAVNFLETTLGLSAQVHDGGESLRFRDNNSLLVNVDGRFRGNWVDFSHHRREIGKSIASLLQHLNIVSCHAEASHMMRKWVEANGLSLHGRVEQMKKQSIESLKEREEKTLESVRTHWMNASPLSHESSRIGRNYLRKHRGFAAAPRRLIEDNPSLYFRTMSYSQGGKVVAQLPTVLALVHTDDKRLCTFERIFLDPQTHKKTSLGLTKKTYSSLHLGGYPGAQHRQAFFCASMGEPPNDFPTKVIIAEGVEDTLTLAWAHHKYPVYAVIGKGNFSKFCLHRSATLYICLDNDEEDAVQNLKKDLTSRKTTLKAFYKDVVFIRCPQKYKDYNEMLQAEGIDKVRISVKEQVGE